MLKYIQEMLSSNSNKSSARLINFMGAGNATVKFGRLAIRKVD